jgi:hypothetical protein
MKIQSARAFTPSPRSLAAKIGRNPSIDFVVGRDLATVGAAPPLSAFPRRRGQTFVPVKDGAAAAVARDTLMGQRLAFAAAGLELIEGKLPLTGLGLPPETDTVFEIVGVAISGAETYHAFARADASVWDQALSVAQTMSGLADLLSPLFPALKPYQPALQGVQLVLKVVKVGTEWRKGESEYRVLQIRVQG